MKKIILTLIFTGILNLVSSQTWNNPSTTQSHLFFNIDGGDPTIKYDTGTGFTINSKYQEKIIFTDGGSVDANLVIDGLNGNVGIGITPLSTSPYKLEVGGSVKIQSRLGVNNATPIVALDVNADQWAWTARFNQPSLSTNSYNTVVFEGAMTSVRGYLGIGGSGVSDLSFQDAFAVGTQTAHHAFINTNDLHRVRIDGVTGDVSFYHNVGIGTTTPDSKLTVAGKIHAQEVKVTVNAGADFVFNDDYSLPKLEDVEKFINVNKHLPDIAPEKEMQTNGLLLAEMNIKLLQKIEELTLYTIQQQKLIENLQEKTKHL